MLFRSISGERIGFNNIYFSATGANAVGTFPVGVLQLQSSPNMSLIQPFNVTFTSFANIVGEFYEGSFNGSYTDNGATHTISTTFKVRRSF